MTPWQTKLLLLAILGGFAATTTQAGFVKAHGKLSVKGTQLVDEHDAAISLRGVSFGWHNWWPRFYNKDSVGWLARDFQCNVVRAAMGVGPAGAYQDKKEWSTDLVGQVVEGAIEYDVYVIIDWHSHEIRQAEAVEFFSAMAEKYGRHPNVLYEIFNEPVEDSWEEVKAYSVEVIKAIRAKDPDNVILVGSPHWDQDIHLAAAGSIEGFRNLMYTLHFYAGSHGQWLRDRANEARKMGLPIFVSELGGMDESGNGPIAREELGKWVDWMEKNRISWLCWSIADKNESCSMLKPSADSEGGWTQDDLKEWGQITRARLRSLNHD
jgi:endoglucanase